MTLERSLVITGVKEEDIQWHLDLRNPEGWRLRELTSRTNMTGGIYWVIVFTREESS